MMVQLFKLDDLVIKDIPALGNLKEVIEMDNDLKSWSQHFDETKLRFYGDGFKYLKSLKDQYGYHRKVSVTISLTEDDGLVGFGDVIHGNIYLTDITIQHTQNYIEVELIEVYSEGLIKQNQNADVNLFNVFKSINGVDISAYAPPRVFLHPFDPDGGSLYGTSHYGVNLVDALKFLVKYTTDDKLDFRDDYFLDNWGTHKFCVINGYELRTGDHKVIVKGNLQNLLEEAWKIFGIWWYIDYSHYKPVFVIDSYQNITAQSNGQIMENVRGIKESFYQENFYNSIDIGTKTFILPPDSSTYWLKFFNGFTHHLETYNGRNNTMIDQKLDLVSGLVMDHNVITEVVKAGSSLYDNEVFLIECDNTGFLTDEATQYTYGNLETDTRKLYNENLLNYNRLSRFDLPINLGFDSGSTDDNFEASGSSDYTNDDSPAINLIPYPYDTEISDPNSHYDPTLSKYVCPTGAPGNYGFYMSLQFVVNDIGTADCVQVTFYFKQYYASGTLKYSHEKNVYFSNNTGSEGELIFFNKNILLAEGDYIIPNVRVNDVCPDGTSGGTSNITIKGSESFFKTLYVQNLGGLVNGEADIKAYYGSKIEFKKNISLAQWKRLKANMIQDIKVTKSDGRMALTKASKISRKIISGEAQVELITKTSKLSL